MKTGENLQLMSNLNTNSKSE